MTTITIDVVADPDPPMGRRHEPVTIGVAFGRGQAHEHNAWSLLDPNGQTVPVQLAPLERWSDGSIRWLLVDFQADVPPAGAARYELRSPHGASASIPESLLQVEHAEGGAIIVRTGAATFHVRQTGHFLFSSVHAGGAAVIDQERSAIVATDTAGRSHHLAITGASVECSGPLRVVVRLVGRLTVSDGAIVDVAARLHFFAGLGTVRAELSITNPRAARHRDGYWDLGDPGSVSFRDISVVCATAEPIEDIVCSVDSVSSFTNAGESLEIYQDSSGGDHWQSCNHVNRDGEVTLRLRGYRLVAQGSESHGLRATPIVRAVADGVQLAIAMPEFWQNFPKAIEAARDAVTLRLFPRQSADVHELQGGERKTHTFYLCFGGDSITREAPLAWTRSPLLAIGDRSGYEAAGAWQPIRVGTAEARAAYHRLVNAAIEGPDSFALKREVIDEFGWRHFGDINADHEAAGQPGLISHYNNQYDAIAGFATRFCETGDRRWWAAMQQLAVHVADIDVYHCTGDKSAYNNGLFWHTSHYAPAGTATHRSYSRQAAGASGGPSNEHNYTTGLLMHYFLTGCERSREAVLQLAGWVLDMDDGARSVFWWIDRGETGLASATRDPDYHGPGRGSAYSINALLDAHRLTGDERYLTKADRLVRRCIHPADDPQVMNLLEAERRWSYTVFLQVLGKYLEYRTEKGLIDRQYAYARAALLQYAEWMGNHERPYLNHPERLEYPTETWAAQDIRKAAVFEFSARYAPASDLRDRLLERSQAFFNYSVSTLTQMPTRTLARPVVLLLAYAFQRPLRNPAADAVQPRFPGVNFGSKRRFIAYRRRIVFKLVLLTASAIVFLLALFLGALRLAR